MRLYGLPPEAARTSTVAFTVNGMNSTEVARALAGRALYLSNGDFFAHTVLQRLDLQDEGLVRAGCACYTSDEEIERLLEAVRTLS